MNSNSRALNAIRIWDFDRWPDSAYPAQTVEEYFEQWVRSEHPDYDEEQIAAMMAEFANAAQWVRDEFQSLMELEDQSLRGAANYSIKNDRTWFLYQFERQIRDCWRKSVKRLF